MNDIAFFAVVGGLIVLGLIEALIDSRLDAKREAADAFEGNPVAKRAA